jgi:hypothetical protein
MKLGSATCHLRPAAAVTQHSTAQHSTAQHSTARRDMRSAPWHSKHSVPNHQKAPVQCAFKHDTAKHTRAALPLPPPTRHTTQPHQVQPCSCPQHTSLHMCASPPTFSDKPVLAGRIHSRHAPYPQHTKHLVQPCSCADHIVHMLVCPAHDPLGAQPGSLPPPQTSSNHTLLATRCSQCTKNDTMCALVQQKLPLPPPFSPQNTQAEAPPLPKTHTWCSHVHVLIKVLKVLCVQLMIHSGHSLGHPPPPGQLSPSNTAC